MQCGTSAIPGASAVPAARYRGRVQYLRPSAGRECSTCGQVQGASADARADVDVHPTGHKVLDHLKAGTRYSRPPEGRYTLFSTTCRQVHFTLDHMQAGTRQSRPPAGRYVTLDHLQAGTCYSRPPAGRYTLLSTTCSRHTSD